MSKGGGSTEVETAEPWKKAQPYIEKGFQEASSIYDTFTPQWYAGQTQADFSPDSLTAQAGIRDWATKGAPNIMNPALQAYKYGTGSSILDVANNPYVSGMARAAAQDAFSNLPGQFSNIRSGSVLSGGYGGGRQGIAEGTAIAGASDSANRAAANIYGQAYGQGLGHQANTLGMTGGLMSAGFQPYEQLGQVGAQQTAREQALIEDAKAKHEFEQALPYDQLREYQSLISGLSPLTQGSGITTSPGMSKSGQAGETIDVLAALGKLSQNNE